MDDFRIQYVGIFNKGGIFISQGILYFLFIDKGSAIRFAIAVSPLPEIRNAIKDLSAI